MDRLVFGTAGIPHCTKNPKTDEGIKEVQRLGLSAMELEFVHSVNISAQKAPNIKNIAKAHNVTLTCHGQYYINLNAKESEKIKASCERIIKAGTIASLCGAYSLCFHAAFYLGQPKNDVYGAVKKNLQEISETLTSAGYSIWIRPETTGKESQFGTLDEILSLSSEIDHVMPCVDFAHLHARSNGSYNSYKDFYTTFEKIENVLGKEGLNNMHIHVAGIDYGQKGEKKHLNLLESDLNYRTLLQSFKDFSICGVVISESPNIEGDSILMRDYYNEL